MRYGVDDTKYIQTIQEALIELSTGQMCPDTINQLIRESKEVNEILRKG